MIINKAKEQLQKECFEAIKEANFNCGIILPTGVGKSKILCDIIKYLGFKRILYLCDNTRLRDVDFPNELIKWGLEEYVDIIERHCYQTAYKWGGEHYDLLLADESDAALTEQYSKVFFNNTFKHTILVSATLSKEKRALCEQIVPIVFEKHIGEVVDKGVVNGEQVYFVNFMLTPAENSKYLSFNDQFKKLLNDEKSTTKQIEFVQISRKHFLSNLDSAAKVCKELLKKLFYEKESNKILVFCELTDQADRITKYTYHTKNSDEDNLAKFVNGHTRVLGVVGKINRGVNIEGVNNIIFESPSQSETKITQQSGRARRLSIDEIVHMFFLIPYFIDRRGEKRSTIVEKWVRQSTKKLDLTKVKILNL